MENQSIDADQGATLQKILTEKELLGLTGLTRQQLDHFRYNQKLPFIKVNARTRLYLEKDIYYWLLKKRMILNQYE